jgi:hypothetical protein
LLKLNKGQSIIKGMPLSSTRARPAGTGGAEAVQLDGVLGCQADHGLHLEAQLDSLELDTWLEKVDGGIIACMHS